MVVLLFESIAESTMESLSEGKMRWYFVSKAEEFKEEEDEEEKVQNNVFCLRWQKNNRS